MNISIKTAVDLVRHTERRSQRGAARPIYDDLRQRILSLDLPPGTNLLRTELAAKYQVSQTPLRDALQRLQRDDLVQIFPQSRTTVTRIDVPKIHEAYFLRVAVETEVMRHLAREGAPELLENARPVIELQRAVAEDRSEIRLFQELDEHFHQMLFEELGRQDLHALIQSHSGHLDRVRRLQVHSDAKIASILSGHEAMLDAVEARDEVTAMAALREHLRKPPDWFDDIRARHADYFA